MSCDSHCLVLQYFCSIRVLDLLFISACVEEMRVQEQRGHFAGWRGRMMWFNGRDCLALSTEFGTEAGRWHNHSEHGAVRSR